MKINTAFNPEIKHLRKGQALMVSLRMSNEDLYFAITGTDADCFYDDSKIENFQNAIETFYNRKSNNA
jgi:hypothetical protein